MPLLRSEGPIAYNESVSTGSLREIVTCETYKRANRCGLHIDKCTERLASSSYGDLTEVGLEQQWDDAVSLVIKRNQ